MGWQRGGRILLALATATAVSTSVSGTASGGLYQTAPWESEGAVVSVGEPAPPVEGATGSFVMGDLTRTGGGDISQAVDESGQVTVYLQPGTRYLDDHDGDGEYAKATQVDVLVPGERVFVAGRFQRADDRVTLFANYIWNPPVAELPPPGPANPTPQERGDYLMNRLFGVAGRVTEPGTTAVGTIGWSKFNGFTVGGITDYGCESAGCHVEAVAAAHNGHLRISTTPLTTYWEGIGGGQYRKTTDRYRVVELLGSQGVSVSGRYTWDGVDWRFVASHVFAPPPTDSAPGGPTGVHNATVREVEQGTFDEVTGIWRGSEWSGTMDPGGKLGLSTVTLTLDWFLNSSGHWEFAGTYSVVTPAPSQTSLAGEISGTVPSGSNPSPLEAVTSVAQATGDWNGWSGYGSARGGATFTPGTTGEVTPPIEARAGFQWYLVPPS